MHDSYDSHELLTKQDYGPWLDSLDLYEIDGKFYLQEKFGYSKPYDECWYELSAKPSVTLTAVFGLYDDGLFCGAGDPKVFEEELGVSLTSCEDPT